MANGEYEDVIGRDAAISDSESRPRRPPSKRKKTAYSAESVDLYSIAHVNRNKQELF